jgi:NTP pyrophosphatase (non-canonical NTP hydrolase)
MRLIDDLQKVFPKLDLNPTIESTMIKLAEEVGECSEVVGKVRGMSGEDRSAVLLKLLSRDMGREIAEVMSRQAVVETEVLRAITQKYQRIRENIHKKEMEGQEIQARIARELLDIMQTCATFMYQLEVDHDKLMEEHREKLIRRGYLK